MKPPGLKSILRHLFGWLCILAGTIMLITPGQGILTLLIGVYLLADEIPFFQRIKFRIQQRFPHLTPKVHDLMERLKNRFHWKQ